MQKSLMRPSPQLHPQPLPGMNRGECNNSHKNMRNGSCVTLEDSGFSHMTSPVNCFTMNYTQKGQQKTEATGVTVNMSLMSHQCHL